jgi:hypothetical protein
MEYGMNILLLFLGILSCGGVERWPVKVLRDGITLSLTAQPSTIKEQCELTRPLGNWLTLPRQKDESQLYRVSGMLISAGTEADHDLHLVVSDGRRTMIAEIPDPDCLPANDEHIPLFRVARHFIDSLLKGKEKGKIKDFKPIPVTLTGYGFWDKPNHGTGHSINGRELHPCVFITRSFKE